MSHVHWTVSHDGNTWSARRRVLTHSGWRELSQLGVLVRHRGGRWYAVRWGVVRVYTKLRDAALWLVGGVP